jgi:phosphoribosylaminoimidazole-succinocarboxamide synthase
MQVVTQTDIKELKLLSRGKVRDIYELDDSSLLIVTTDRMSAFDVIMGRPIPYKGVVLNKITEFWMGMFAGLIDNHIIATDPADFPEVLAPYADMLEGRALVAKRAKPLPIECVVRGYISGSGWKDYLATGKVCGHTLPENMKLSDKLERPLFTPATKAEIGDHDENITIEQARALMPGQVFDDAERISMEIYKRAREYAAQRGIIIADTKFEFGLVGGELIIIDEVLTPDSSRFWPAGDYEPGRIQKSFDKQYLRDWLETTDWDKTPPAPELPDEVVANTMRKYHEAYEFLTGGSLGL